MHKLIALSEIKIAPDRHRREFKEDELRQLIESITERGLFHPIVLRVVGEDYVLVAGERRMRAAADIYLLGESFKYDSETVRTGCIPYVSLSELSPLEAEEAELEENERRTSLTWQERAAAHARLKSLRDAQALAAGLPVPTTADIATEVRGTAEGKAHETTRRELIVAKHLHNPAVAAAATVDDAFKILRREESAEKNRALGELVGRTFTADLHRVFNADSKEWLAACGGEQFDVILTDPPYGMGADEFGDSGGLAAGAHGYQDDAASFMSLMEVFIPESFRVTKPQAHLYLFCDQDQFKWLRGELGAVGWNVFRTMLIWHKPQASRAPWPENGPWRRYETFLYAMKGKKPTLKLAPDVVTYGPDTNLNHAAQKPVLLFQDLLSRSCRPGDSILDPFCGSGPIFPAAHTLKCQATGVELDTASYGIAVKRIEQLKMQMEIGL